MEKNPYLLKAAQAWQQLADDEAGMDAPSINRKRLYKRTAESLRLQAIDGVARCACCLFPYGDKRCDNTLLS